MIFNLYNFICSIVDIMYFICYSGLRKKIKGVKMTEMQILRNALFDEITRIKRGTTTQQDVISLTKVSNCIIQSFNTEIKAGQLLLSAQEKGSTTIPVKVFEDSDLKVITEEKDE